MKRAREGDLGGTGGGKGEMSGLSGDSCVLERFLPPNICEARLSDNLPPPVDDDDADAGAGADADVLSTIDGLKSLVFVRLFDS